MSSTQQFAEPGVMSHQVMYSGVTGLFVYDAEYVVVDVETSGFDAFADARILEIAALRTSGDGQVIESFHTLVNPGDGRVGAEFIHGISPSMLMGAPSFEQIWPALRSFLSDAIFVAHNAQFDASFLDAETRRIGIAMDVMPGLCTYWLGRRAMPHLERHKLETIAAALGIKNHGAHRAFDDALVVVEALPHLLTGVQLRHHAEVTPKIARFDVPIKVR